MDSGILALRLVLGLLMASSVARPREGWAVLVAGILGGTANLALRRKPAPAPAAA